MNFAQKHNFFAKVRLTFLSMLYSHFAKYKINPKICPGLFKMCQSGEIWPNLVTLETSVFQVSTLICCRIKSRVKSFCILGFVKKRKKFPHRHLLNLS